MFLVVLLAGILICCIAESIPLYLQNEFFSHDNSSKLCSSSSFYLRDLSCSQTAFRGTSSEQFSQHENRCDLIRDHVYFHAIFDFRRPSSLPLFLNQVCRALELCIARSNFRVVLHLERKRIRRKSRGTIKFFRSTKCQKDFLQAQAFLKSLDIPFTVWTGEFDTISSQRARIVALRDLKDQDTSKWILQVDADEFPIFYPNSLSEILHRLQTSSHSEGCDAVYGYLSERVQSDGKLVNISLSLHLQEQFPLLCNVKESVEKAQNRKLVLYRAAFRAGIGNHRLICERKHRSIKEEEMESCQKIIRKRLDFVSMHPPVLSLPRKCEESLDKIPLLDIEHFKYTWGLEEYLQERIRVFRKNKIAWHGESSAVIQHVEKYGGICVACPELKCRNATLHF